MKRIAVSKLKLPNGEILKNQIIEWTDDNYVSYYPLTEELPFTEWKDIIYELSAEKIHPKHLLT